MRPSPYYYDSLYRHTKADADLFKRWTDFLPRRKPDEPYHSGPHSIKYFRQVFELIRPKGILEIGFNLGHSTVIWLELGVQKVWSVEIRDDDRVSEAVSAINARYPQRFGFDIREPGKCLGIFGSPELIFIDGSHECEDVKADIGTGIANRIPYFLMDDYDSHHGPGVVAAVGETGLIPLGMFGTMLLCVPPDRYTQRSHPLGTNYYE